MLSGVFSFGSSKAARQRCVRDLIACLNERDYDHLDRVVTSDVVVHDANALELRGRQKLASQMREFDRRFGERRIVIETMDNHGDSVLVRGIFEAAAPELAGPAMWQVSFKRDKISLIETTRAASQMTLPKFAAAGVNH